LVSAAMESVSHRRIAVLFVQLACLLLGASVKPGASNSAPDMYLCSNLNTSYVTLSGVSLIQFEARDPENDNVAMTLVGKDQSIYFFSVVSYPNNRTAVLKQNSRLDADSLNKISLVLQIKLNDGNLNEITKDFDLVIVRDINDNPPEFQNLPYRWLIPE
uniref:Cadherin domain-containing protein n=1 Tax=Macrostomum lignano TaxID=282301 RepID=A0A1I8HI91_9PLAT